MSQLLRIDNYSSNNIVERTALSTDSLASANSFSVVNNSSFLANKYFALGRLGSDTLEILAVNSITGANTVTSTTAAALAHNKFDAVTLLYGNKIKVYRAANVDGTIPGDGSFSSIATIDIQADQNSTDYTDSTGSANYWYKSTYFNSLTSEETNLADSIASRGGGYDTYCSIDDIRKEAGLTANSNITDADIDSKRRQAQATIDGSLQGLYSVPFAAPVNPMIEELTIKMAAGLILKQDYGPFATGNSKSGQDKIDEANALLKEIDDKHYVLTDTLGNDLSIKGAGGIKSYPDSTADTLPVADGGSSRAFRYGMRF